jgi:hypothetical protein
MTRRRGDATRRRGDTTAKREGRYASEERERRGEEGGNDRGMTMRIEGTRRGGGK